MPETNPLTLTTNPRLSLALQADGPGFEEALEAVGQEKAEAWFRNRIGDEVEQEMLHDAIARWFDATSLEDRVMARVELAELTEDADGAVSELLWEASMRDGFERDDSDQAFDGAAHLARLAETSGDPLTAAESYIEFLNWRRTEGHVSDPETVHHAFEEVIRLAELDGAAQHSARFQHAHSVFTRIADEDEASASEGDWAPQTPPYTGWE